MKLYGHPIAPTTQMILMCLAEKNKQHGTELVVIDLPNGEQQSPEHVARHPFGKTPVLEDADGMIYEARAILRYLDRALDGPALTPASARDYGLMEQFISVETAYYTPEIMVHFYKKLLGMDPGDEALAAASEGAGKALDVVEAALSERPYLGGDQLSLAEIVWTPYLEIAAWTGNAGLISSRPKVAAWWEGLRARESWATLNPYAGD